MLHWFYIGLSIDRCLWDIFFRACCIREGRQIDLVAPARTDLAAISTDIISSSQHANIRPTRRYCCSVLHVPCPAQLTRIHHSKKTKVKSFSLDQDYRPVSFRKGVLSSRSWCKVQSGPVCPLGKLGSCIGPLIFRGRQFFKINHRKNRFGNS